jgi:threonine/homoserine/homoserine lactone efflux protein
MIGVGLIIATQSSLFLLLKIVGATYLIFVDYQTFVSKPIEVNKLEEKEQNIDCFKAFKVGFLTNALNPKTTLCVLSTYSQLVSPDTLLWQQYGYGLFMLFAHWVWFSLVCVFFSSPQLRNKMLNHQKPINKIVGGILIALGGLLAVTSIFH